VLPYADTDMMQLHLDEISRNVAEGAHAVLLLDRAGWHTTGKLDVPDNITPIFLPSRAPELNAVENVWQYLRQNWLSNTVFENYDAIDAPACAAWRKLIAQPETIPPSECATGLTSVRRYDPWYKRSTRWNFRQDQE
jgi:transposase